MDRGFEEEWRVEEFGKGFFSKKGFISNIRLAPFSKTSSRVKSL
jgi:hypothetical protein